MTDRELLELAAKAYWGSEIDDVCSVRWLDKDECIGFMHGDNQDHNGLDVELCWNPLWDDGDALRLQKKLHFNVHWDESCKDWKVYAGSTLFAHDKDLNRAITLAASRSKQ